MGYKTKHRLKLDPPLTTRQIVEVLMPDLDLDNLEYPIEDYYRDLPMGWALEPPTEAGWCATFGRCKWDEDPDLCKLSAAHPHVRFTLEVGNDIHTSPEYVTYYYGGEKASVSPMVVIPPSPLWVEIEG